MPAEIQRVTNSFLELMPGLSSTPANLKTLLSRITRGEVWSKDATDLSVMIKKHGTKKKPRLWTSLEGPWRTRTDPITGQTYQVQRPIITYDIVPATEDGLLGAILFLKKAIRKYRVEGTCETCPPNAKRLKGDGMPRCTDCVLGVAIGQ